MWCFENELKALCPNLIQTSLRSKLQVVIYSGRFRYGVSGI